jgi:hypothetical protein
MDLRKIENRLQIIDEINGPENKKRKDDSFICSEVYNGRLRQYVIEYLCTLFHPDTVKEMPVQSGCHLTKKIVKERATIYNDSVNRNFEDVSDEQLAVLESIYKDTQVDYLMGKANEFFVLQNQVMLQLVPKDGAFKLKVLKMHHFDAITAKDDPTELIGVVISSYDKKFKRDEHGNFNPLDTGSISNPHKGIRPDGVDQAIADEDDTGPSTFEVWTKKYFDKELQQEIPAMQFIMDKDGSILSQDPLSPIDILPFVSIHGYQDHQFYAEDQKSMTEFCIEYNSINSELAQMFRMQSYSQAVLTGPPELLPKDSEFAVGPNRTLILKSDPDLGSCDFSFRSPGGNVQGGIEYLEMLLAQFLSSIGVDPKVISKESGQTFNSGIERLLSMIERYSATKNDYILFEQAEKNLLRIIKAYLEAYQGTDILDLKYRVQPLSDYCEVTVNYSKPEGATTFKEKVEQQEKLMALGLANRTTAVKELYGFGQEEAEEYIRKIDSEQNVTLQAIAEAQKLEQEKE